MGIDATTGSLVGRLGISKLENTRWQTEAASGPVMRIMPRSAPSLPEAIAQIVDSVSNFNIILNTVCESGNLVYYCAFSGLRK
jgi:hypothetical protein